MYPKSICRPTKKEIQHKFFLEKKSYNFIYHLKTSWTIQYTKLFLEYQYQSLLLLHYYRPPEHDAPVQGPLPYEPDDAPWKKTNESGIRKL